MGDEEAFSALAAWELGGEPKLTRITRGLLHQTFLVEVSGGEPARYVLQCVNPIFDPGIHDNIAAVTGRLAERGVPTPRLVATRAGAWSADLGDGGRWRLLTHVSGRSVDTCPSPAWAAAAARLVARFHGALVDLEHDFRPLGFPFHDTPWHFETLRAALRSGSGHRLHAEVEALAARIFAAAETWQPLGAVPDRVVHLDLKFNNVLFAAEGDPPEAVALIDLDTLSRRPYWVELGDAWRSWCNRRPEHESRAEFDPAIFFASAGAWLDALPLAPSRPELESLAWSIERISLELCARFAADALEERYFGWKPDLFETRGDHNLSRARGQLSLHDQARETRPERRRYLLG